MSKELEKLQNPKLWRKWGPYVSDRQWGTVREDYSADGEAWNFITHDMARSKAYRWGEEGIAGISDDNQFLCLALSLWNGQDSILKERLFGLTGSQGNHGEDVKEYYYYLDNTPTHSYQKMLYKYPMAAFPYQWLLDENARRNRSEPEFELIDTGIFNDNKYFDIFIEYAKNDTEDILAQYTVYNRSATDAPLHLLPTLWFRNTLDWADIDKKPHISIIDKNALLLSSKNLGDYYCYVEGDAKFLFTDNETNYHKLYHYNNASHHTKDGINDYVVNNAQNAINHTSIGTKASAYFLLNVPAHGSLTVKLRLTKQVNHKPFDDFDTIVEAQKAEADLFYEEKQKKQKTAANKLVQRQAWAGMLWSKQYYYYNVAQWLAGDPNTVAPPEGHKTKRNTEWTHLRAADVISMPDKWEYPWFAAWDLAFHCIVFADIDPQFAKEQLLLLTEDRYMRPDGQIPAYEWNFSDVNPPVHATAAWKVFLKDKELNNGVGDKLFLQKILHKLLLNFNWWVNNKDAESNHVFEGGFLGLDNIGIFDRSAAIPNNGILEQSDGTSWMAMYSLNLTRISVELALDNPVYEDLAIKFAQHFFYIAGAMANMGDKEGSGLWDDDDGFYYDRLKMPNREPISLRFRTIVGLVPLFAVEVVNANEWSRLTKMNEVMMQFLKDRPDLARLVSNWYDNNGGNNKQLLSLLRGHRMKCLFKHMLDENEFLSPYGIRSVSKIYEENPFEINIDGEYYSMRYAPAESDIAMFGGNSNWRGPIWMPMNYLIIDAMLCFYEYYGDDFKVEYPTHSRNFFNIKEIADALAQRVNGLFLPNKENEFRPFLGDNQKLQQDELFNTHVLFYEYFHGDNGKGLGASHQTGWTGLVALTN